MAIPTNTPAPRPKRLVILCDGTWCGRETNTKSNIQMLAEMMGVRFDSKVERGPDEPAIFIDEQRGVKVAYFDGIGLGKTFLEYLYDGATAATIGDECTAAYNFIVEHYDDAYEIWMFGLSRGAYTVRSVAGMINNCGIIRNRPADLRKTLCEEVYKMYRSPYKEDSPDSEQSKAFKSNKENVWQVKTPIKFMGLLDTVGSLGIPKLDPGVAGNFDYPQLYDQTISPEVEKVYHALSLHDRLWAFEPCFASRDPEAQKKNPNLEIVEKWFPGCHYDLGRQRFRFLRQSSNIVEKVLGYLPSILSQTVEPNEVLSDLVLRWMLESIEKVDSKPILIPDIRDQIARLTWNMIKSGEAVPGSKDDRTGTGDVYANVLPYSPFGTIWAALGVVSHKTVTFLDKVTGRVQLGSAIDDLLGIKTILRSLLATRDRRIPHRNANVEIYTEPLPGCKYSVDQLARVSEKYQSQTYQSFFRWKMMMGDITPEECRRHEA